MSGPVKHLLVYADGRVEDAGTELCGMYFIKAECIDGDWWQRKFEIHLAHHGREPMPGTCTMVGIERSFVLTRTAAQVAEDDAKQRAESMKRALWGIRNYPGDEDGK